MAGLLVLLAVPLSAQSIVRGSVVDQARMHAGIAIGTIGGIDLWTVASQPVFAASPTPDFFALSRSLHRDVTVSGHFTYYPGTHLGFSGEYTYLGLGSNDSCALVVHHGDAGLKAACDSLHQTYHSASVTNVQGGLTFRPFTRHAVQPYVRGTVGLAFVPSSPVEMSTIYGHRGGTSPLVISIYKNPHWRSLRPSWMLGGGFATRLGTGLQVRVEARETWLTLHAVTGPTASQGLEPPTRSTTVRLTSLLVGADMIFARARGREH